MKIHRYLMIFTRDFLALWDPEDTNLIESVARGLSQGIYHQKWGKQ